MGDIAAGVGVPVQQLAMVFGQVKAAGRLMTNDMNQFTNAGVGLIKPLAVELGIAESKVREFAEKGKISFATFQNALVRLRAEDFAGGMEKQSRTALGALSTLQDQTGGLMRQIAEGLGKNFNVTEWVNDLAGFVGYVRQEWGPDLIKAFGEIANGINDAFGPTRETLISTFNALQSFNLARGMMFKGTVSEDTLGAGAQEWANIFGKAANALAQSRDISSFLKEHSVKPPPLKGLDKENARAPEGRESLFNLLGGARFKGVGAGGDPFAAMKALTPGGAGMLGNDWGKAFQAAMDREANKGNFDPMYGAGARFNNIMRSLSHVGSDVGRAFGDVGDRFRIRGEGRPERQPTGALVAGSSEFYSAMIRNMFGQDKKKEELVKLDGIIKAVEKTGEKTVEAITGQITGVLGALGG